MGYITTFYSWYEPRHDKTSKTTVHPAKTQISLGIRTVWSVFAVRMKKAWVLSYPMGHSEYSDQAGQMPRLIWVFAGRTLILLVLSLLSIVDDAGTGPGVEELHRTAIFSTNMKPYLDHYKVTANCK